MQPLSRPSIPYRPPVTDITRAIEHVRWLAGSASATLTAVEADAISELARLAGAVVAPTDAVGDARGAVLAPSGQVVVPQELAVAHRAVIDGGWNAAALDEGIGGGGLDSVVGAALTEMLTSANLALSLNFVLTHGAIRLLENWASASQRSRLLPPLVAGEWSATMLLTEADAGSDLGAVRTHAQQCADGSWRLRGTKIFATWAEHDLSANILHLVLARTDGAPPGTRGLSLFAVPKVLPDGRGNNIACVGLENKLGIHASPTCVMQLDDAVGELVGEQCTGMPAMFRGMT